MISIVYPLGNGSKFQDFELKMSLRSIEKHLSGFTNVVIVGHKPRWIQNVVHIPAEDPYHVPDRNIMEKICLACNHPDVTEEHLFFNDDHYLLDNFDAPTFPYFYYKTLEEYTRRRVSMGDSYGQRARNTMNLLKSNNLPTLMYDIHTPIRYKKDEFIKHVASAPWENSKDGFVIKSLYANSVEIGGIETPDYKLNSHPPAQCRVMSSFPHMKALVQRFLLERFPKPSRFEII